MQKAKGDASWPFMGNLEGTTTKVWGFRAEGLTFSCSILEGQRANHHDRAGEEAFSPCMEGIE